MADFISQLSGQEMDSALQEVNAHNAEAWSSGTRGGMQVGSGDPTYDNNAKYWAGVAKSAVPSGSAAAVLWNQEQQLTDAQKAQARKNISAGGSNPNLLDNGWLTVDQRGGLIAPIGVPYFGTWVGAEEGLTTQPYTAIHTPQGFDDQYQITINGVVKYVPKPYLVKGYTQDASAFVNITDRYKMLAGTLIFGDEYKTFKNTGNIGYALLEQRFTEELINKITGKTVTLSIMLEDGSVVSNSYTYQRNVELYVTFGGDYIRLTSGVFQLVTTSECHFKAFKLEVGSTSTLANDVAPNDAEELAKCQRYYYQSTTPYISTSIYNANIALCDVRFPVPMRTTPSIKICNSDYSQEDRVTYFTNGSTPNVRAYERGVFSGNEGFSSIGFSDSGIYTTVPVLFQVKASAEL